MEGSVQVDVALHLIYIRMAANEQILIQVELCEHAPRHALHC